MITKEQLQAMSDFEVDAALASMAHAKMFTPDEIAKLIKIGGIPCDYCNNTSDIMPLAFEHGIWIQSVDGRDGRYWTAGANTYHAMQHDNPLRAIACCLILVLQEKQK